MEQSTIDGSYWIGSLPLPLHELVQTNSRGWNSGKKNQLFSIDLNNHSRAIILQLPSLNAEHECPLELFHVFATHETDETWEHHAKRIQQTQSSEYISALGTLVSSWSDETSVLLTVCQCSWSIPFPVQLQQEQEELQHGCDHLQQRSSCSRGLCSTLLTPKQQVQTEYVCSS